MTCSQLAISFRGFGQSRSIENMPRAKSRSESRSVYSSPSYFCAQSSTLESTSSAVMCEMIFLLTSLSFAMSNRQPLTLIFLRLNGNFQQSSEGLALRQSSKFELSSVMMYSMTLSFG